MVKPDVSKTFYDLYTGIELDPEKVMKARREELNCYTDMDTHSLAPIAECWNRTKAAPIRVRWIDHNKGDEQIPDIRCRLVGKDFKKMIKEMIYLLQLLPWKQNSN